MQQFGDCTTVRLSSGSFLRTFLAVLSKYFGGMSKSGGGFRSWAIRNSDR